MIVRSATRRTATTDEISACPGDRRRRVRRPRARTVPAPSPVRWARGARREPVASLRRSNQPENDRAHPTAGATAAWPAERLPRMIDEREQAPRRRTDRAGRRPRVQNTAVEPDAAEPQGIGPQVQDRTRHEDRDDDDQDDDPPRGSEAARASAAIRARPVSTGRRPSGRPLSGSSRGPRPRGVGAPPGNRRTCRASPDDATPDARPSTERPNAARTVSASSLGRIVAARAGSNRNAARTARGARHGRVGSSGGTSHRQRELEPPGILEDQPGQRARQRRPETRERRIRRRAGRWRDIAEADHAVAVRHPHERYPPAVWSFRGARHPGAQCSPTRTSCSRRYDGPGGGSRSGTRRKSTRPSGSGRLGGPRRRAGVGVERLVDLGELGRHVAQVLDRRGRLRPRSPVMPRARDPQMSPRPGARTASAWRFATSASSSRRSISRRTLEIGWGERPGLGRAGRRVRVLAADPGQQSIARSRDGCLGTDDRGGVDGRQARKGGVSRRVDRERGAARRTGFGIAGVVGGAPRADGDRRPSHRMRVVDHGGMLPRPHRSGIPHRSGVCGVPHRRHSHSIVAGGLELMS